MDESWRMRMGKPKGPPPPPARYALNHLPGRSTEAAASHSHRKKNPVSDEALNPEDFEDVFGGPPRTVLSGQFATVCQRSPSSSSRSFIYEEIFRPPEMGPPPAGRIGRSLPEFRIPGQKSNDFYSDIFGWEDHERVVRSRSVSKASSSSVLSSGELSPLRPVVSVDGHDDVSYFASKLRPINVRSRWTSRTMIHEDESPKQHMMPPLFANTQPFYNPDSSLKDYSFGLSRRNTSPDTISLDPISNGDFPDDYELNSPSSAVSSVSPSSNEKQNMENGFLGYEEDDHDNDDVDDDLSSYVIEINSDNRGGSTYESNDVDEAIAWAKEKFQTQCEMKKPGQEILNGHQASDQGHLDSFGALGGRHNKWVLEEDKERFESKVQTETQILDEKLRMWSAGKGANIWLLLSSLHQILWPESGWFPVYLSDLTEVSQVKKAYQKARLCLHPDKLQQRGATIQQKYIADKAFSLLQDAWEAFIAQRTS